MKLTSNQQVLAGILFLAVVVSLIVVSVKLDSFKKNSNQTLTSQIGPMPPIEAAPRTTPLKIHPTETMQHGTYVKEDQEVRMNEDDHRMSLLKRGVASGHRRNYAPTTSQMIMGKTDTRAEDGHRDTNTSWLDRLRK